MVPSEPSAPEEVVVLSDDPLERAAQLNKIESKRKTEILRKKVQPKAPSKVDVSKRPETAVWLSQLNPELCLPRYGGEKVAGPAAGDVFCDHEAPRRGWSDHSGGGTTDGKTDGVCPV